MRLSVLAAFLALVVLVPSALADVVLGDPKGDAGDAPDITLVVVANDATDRIAFGLALDGAEGLYDGALAAALIDSDRNPATGSASGADFMLVTDGVGVKLVKWEGTDWIDLPDGSGRVQHEVGGVIFGIGRAAFGGLGDFDFEVVALGAEGADFAPDAAQITYTMVPKQVGLTASFQMLSKQPSVNMRAVALLWTDRTDSLEQLVGGRTTCRAVVGGRSLGVVVSDGPERSKQCGTVRLPGWTKGKTLKLTMTTTAYGKSVSRSWSGKVRA